MLRGAQVYIIDENGDRIPLDLTDIKSQVVDDIETKLDTIIDDVDGVEDKIDEAVDELKVLNSLVPSVFDYVGLTYTGSNLTVAVFKTGGSGGSTVSTLTLAYTGSQLDSVTKT